ncbi:pre-rRNA processing [Coemansia sp. RSA 1822]|nr:pre-rRNA processing [Coemansia sp. RSA 1822]
MAQRGSNVESVPDTGHAALGSLDSKPLESLDSKQSENTVSAMEAQKLRRAASSRFSVLLEHSVDYTAYRQACSRQRLQQPPHFETLRDAEEELKSVLHDKAFEQPEGDGLIEAENVALVVDWFATALAQQFDGDEPFENPDFLQFCCMFFASPLYENNTRLVQRHLVKRTYAELNAGEDTTYAETLWLLLALLHLLTEFQPNTYRLCTDSGLFPLLQRLVIAGADTHLHVLAMSLMFEIAQAEKLSQADLACVTEELLLFLLDYIERMRYADSDIYNNTATKLVLALNEQMLEAAAPEPTVPSFGDQQTLALLTGSAQRSYGRRRRNRGSHWTDGSLSVQSMSPPPEHQTLAPLNVAGRPHHARAVSVSLPGNDDAQEGPIRPVQLPITHALDMEMHLLSRSRSMDFRSQLCKQPANAEQPPRPSSEAYTTATTCDTEDVHAYRRQTLVVTILAQRTDCCKTFTENLVFLLNRETDPATQRLILHMLACILANPGTNHILYTNDLHVLTDIIIRDLSNVSDAEQQLRRSYLRVICVLLRNPGYLAARHRLSDIELCLVSMLRESLVSSHASTVPRSRRGSVGETNTRHNSMAISDLGSSVELRHNGAASPALSLSSAASEETCCARGSGVSELRPSATVHKVVRRPPPPPPSAKQRAQATPSVSSSLCPTQPRRRRAPPPPPSLPATSAHATPSSSPRLDPVHETSESPSPRPTRRKAPPPPPRFRPANEPGTVPTKPPTPPPRTDLRRPKPEQTGIRRQLSVKKSVSRYKRDSCIGRPAPPTPPPRDFSKIAAPMSPVIEVSSEDTVVTGIKPPGSGSETHVDINEYSDEELDVSLEASAEQRRATRVLVANALRGCHEARALALSLGPALHTQG